MTEHLNTATPSNPDERMLNNPDRTLEADKRLQALDEVAREYQNEYPFVVGATVFGSTMHGAANEKSDIDAFVFIDPDAVEAQLGGGSLDAKDYGEMARVVEHDLLSRIGLESGEQSSGRRNDVQMFLVNEEIIDGSVKRFEKTSSTYTAHKAAIDQLYDKYYENTLDLDESFEDFAKRTEGIDVYNEPEFAMMEWGLSALFHPSVGDTESISNIRHMVLDRLATSPLAQEAWNDIASRIETFEGDMHSEVSKFPKKFADAQQAFGNN